MRKYKLFRVLLLVLCCIYVNIIIFPPPSFALEALINDPENDIRRIVVNGTQVVDTQIVGSHDEIDVVKLKIKNQQINLTFASNTNEWEYNEFYPFTNTYANILLTENATVDYSALNLNGPGYKISCRNWSSIYKYPELGLEAFLMYLPNGGSFPCYFWNGTSWFEVDSSNLNLSQPIGSFINNVIEVNIPPEAFEITENFTYYVFTQHNYVQDGLVFIYNDFLPNNFISLNNNIPGYHLIIILGIFATILICFSIKSLQRNKSKINSN